jgi:predicted ArsR family transcriptional regulator
MAEFEMQGDSSFLLIENHCPICAAAKTCQGFCRSELELFRAAFGPDMSVTRQEHLLSEGRRCVYRIARLSCGDDQAGDQGPDYEPMSPR